MSNLTMTSIASAPSSGRSTPRLRSVSSAAAERNDSSTRQAFETEMTLFFHLFTRYLVERAERKELDWERIQSPAADVIVPYGTLPHAQTPKNLQKLAVLKVNGGLGTSMGMTGAKSALEVKNDMTFLDLTVRQIELLNKENQVDVPLILMTSFNTHDDTIRIIKKYANQQLRIVTFNQSRYPRVYKESLMPCPQSADDDKDKWYPPGHGDIYTALVQSGVLDQLLAEGKEYLFISNSDNLGAIVDQDILQYMVDSKAEFIMEVTDKTRADVKGGTLIDYDGHLQLLEIAQVPSEHVDDFKSVRKFKIFNTNNLWINLKALKRVMDKNAMVLDLIINPKVTEEGQSVIQLETAAGAAIKHFKNAHGINVPRSRFLPVKNCSDLLLIKSDIYSLEHGRLVLNPVRMFETTPVIKLGDHFKKIAQFQQRFKQIPKILELDHLTVTGDVYFGRNVTLRGTVIVVANEGQRIDIPDGCILENRLVSGNLNLITSKSQRKAVRPSLQFEMSTGKKASYGSMGTKAPAGEEAYKRTVSRLQKIQSHLDVAPRGNRLKDKVCVITGVGSLKGIGRASAILFAHEGAKHLYLMDFDGTNLLDLKSTIESKYPDVKVFPMLSVTVIQADAADEAAISGVCKQALQEEGRLDVFFANAGIATGQYLTDISSETFMNTHRVNTLSCFLAIKYASEAMSKPNASRGKEYGGGSIILTASIAGIRSGGGSIDYSASKAAVNSMAKTAPYQLRNTDIRVNSLCPGLIETGMTTMTFEYAAARGTTSKIGQLNALGRYGVAEEIANAALFLASDESSYVNGQNLAVDGGLSASHPVAPGKWA
ncbi:hypothetical protein NM688_g3069 [Phlebia brevispora]|uniref:Uncharacterized protein n=1 Tax=Phlebia brevispora TaxID=194682 RepID=A0ACC1T702_9APHY|nr:hypothetical protein NM688_g3069 [Phlebia brevispora]